jgi:hypothetical protein
VQALRVRAEGFLDDLVDDVGAVEVARVDVADAEIDGFAQYGDGRIAVLRRSEDPRPGQLHRAIAHAGEAVQCMTEPGRDRRP